MKRMLQRLRQRPGGWSYAFGQVPKEGMPEWQPRSGFPDQNPSFAFAIGFAIFGVIPTILSGVTYTLCLWSIFVFIPVAGLYVSRMVRSFTFRDLPAKSACRFPRNEADDLWRSYRETVLIATAIWLTLAVLCLTCVATMRAGLGDEWNAFTRTIQMTKGGPYSEYFIIELAMFISGAIALTGLVWWPLTIFFEWLTTRERVRHLQGECYA